MTGVLMWHVGDSAGTGLSEEAAQATTSPIRTDPESAEATRAPDFNEIQTDNSSQLLGLSRRLVGADTVNTEKYSPWWAVLATQNHNEVIDNQVASSGTAASRELSGQQGHGTMQYAKSIDPVLHEGMEMGNDYFLSHPMGIQEGAGNYMSVAVQDDWAARTAQALATQNSREAFNDSLYSSLFG